MTLSHVEFEGYEISVRKAFDNINAGSVFNGRPVLIKPNLVTDASFPVTTHPHCCEAVIKYVRQHTDVDIVIAEGCGDALLETGEIFEALGYVELAQRYGVKLIDLNHEPLVKRKSPACRIFKEILLPEIAFTHLIISVPVLKAHSLSQITGSLKNMMGFVPPKHYGQRYGSWKKASLHQDLHQAIKELNHYRSADLTLMDARIGLAEFHLGGKRCDPPVKRIIAGTDPFETDRMAARLLGLDPKSIPHLINPV